MMRHRPVLFPEMSVRPNGRLMAKPAPKSDSAYGHGLRAHNRGNDRESYIEHWAGVNGMYDAFSCQVPVLPARAVVPVKENAPWYSHRYSSDSVLEPFVSDWRNQNRREHKPFRNFQ